MTFQELPPAFRDTPTVVVDLDAFRTAVDRVLPAYDTLLLSGTPDPAAVRSLGDDIEFAPKNTYMSLRRRKQFACINPATATRVDVGLNLRDVAAQGRLIVEKPGVEPSVPHEGSQIDVGLASPCAGEAG